MDDFWKAVDAALADLTAAKTADDVITTLNNYSTPSSGDAFFAGGGGNGDVADSLRTAGWVTIWRDAWYFWAMQAPDGSAITYVEGDVYKGNSRTRK